VTTNSLQPTFKRQRFLLEFIRQIKDPVTATEIQKLVFLYLMSDGSDHYDFIPYKFGPYSFQLAEDVEILCRDAFLQADSNRYFAAGMFQAEITYPIAAERGDALIRKTYREYPYYAINSEITDRLFTGKERIDFEYAKERYVKTGQMLFTIGYEGRSVEAFVNTLIENDVRLLCDVRKNPLSRKLGFSKNRLEHILGTAGISYSHFPDLGIESEKRTSLETKDDYAHLFEAYAEKLPSYESALKKLYELFSARSRIALMCYEKEPEMCHRHVIRDYLHDHYSMECADL